MPSSPTPMDARKAGWFFATNSAPAMMNMATAHRAYRAILNLFDNDFRSMAVLYHEIIITSTEGCNWCVNPPRLPCPKVFGALYPEPAERRLRRPVQKLFRHEKIGGGPETHRRRHSRIPRSWTRIKARWLRSMKLYSLDLSSREAKFAGRTKRSRNHWLLRCKVWFLSKICG